MTTKPHAHRFVVWGSRHKFAAIFFIGFIAIQIAVPVFQLTQPRPVRFGWQMYSAVRPGAPGGTYILEGPSGARDTIRVTDHVANARSEIDYRRFLPPHLCEVTPDAVAIIFERAGSPLDRYVCP